jgi:hypothetical protein
VTSRHSRWAVVRPLVAVVLVLATAGAVACGSGDDTTSAAPAAPGVDAGAIPHDATTGDACISDGDSSGCRPCATPQTDPYNACSPFASGCIPFDASRVPSHPSL